MASLETCGNKEGEGMMSSGSEKKRGKEKEIWVRAERRSLAVETHGWRGKVSEAHPSGTKGLRGEGNRKRMKLVANVVSQRRSFPKDESPGGGEEKGSSTFW
ncbi:hypothetical protein HAX54_032857 [Datura stramonium]|uniref:Uncharacterized protein n=1 Tax=Datura stramonium TaxID=4076 RepID=A0ABS8VEH5_DATST|nr:hypothetical protein [Datura stramonium]